MTEFENALLAQIGRIADALERLAPAENDDPVLLALAGRFGRNEFTASEVVTNAAAEATAAQAAGLQMPDLPHALQQAEIETAHALGRFLRGFEGREITRIGQDRQGVIWQLAVSCGDETAKVISVNRRRA